MKRSYADTPPAVTLRVDGQEFYARAVSGKSVSVEATRERPFTVRGCQIWGNETFTKGDDGAWTGYHVRSRFPFSAKRLDGQIYSADATPAMSKSFLAAAAKVVAAFVDLHPDLLRGAEAATLNNQIMRMDDEVEKATRALDEAVGARDALRRREAEVAEAIADLDVGPDATALIAAR